jgi:hypothetical protein
LGPARTRARRIVDLVGSKRALAKAVRTPGGGRGYTTLTERLQPGRAGLSQQPARRSAGPIQQGLVGLSRGCCGRIRRQDGQGEAVRRLNYRGVSERGVWNSLACLHRLERGR